MQVAEYNAHPYAKSSSNVDNHVNQEQFNQSSSQAKVETTPGVQPTSYVSQAQAYEDDEDKRSALLAMRARNGDYDDGTYFIPLVQSFLTTANTIRSHQRATSAESRFPYG